MSPASCVLPVLLLTCTCCLGQGANGVYMIVFTSAQNWDNGQKCCAQNAMSLAKVDTQDRFNALRDYMFRYMEGDYYTVLWTGLRASNVSDLSTYNWTDGTAFDAANATWARWDPLGVTQGPACFALTTHNYKWSKDNYLRAYPCTSVFALGCEMTDPGRQPGPFQPGCPSFHNYLVKSTPPGGLAKSAKAERVVMRGRFVKEWSTLQPFIHAKTNLGSEKMDCLLYCLSFNKTMGTQLSFLPNVANARVDKCTCLTSL